MYIKQKKINNSSYSPIELVDGQYQLEGKGKGPNSTNIGAYADFTSTSNFAKQEDWDFGEGTLGTNKELTVTYKNAEYKAAKGAEKPYTVYLTNSSASLEEPKTGGGKEAIDNSSFVGYYADVNDDGEVDGVIYADRAVGSTGVKMWNDDDWSKYQLTQETEGLKEYYIKEEKYDPDDSSEGELWPEMQVVAPIDTASSGKDRFFVMALKDFDDNYHKWASNYGYYIPTETESSVLELITVTETGKEKGVGYVNTGKAIEKLKGDTGSIFSKIQTEYNKGWYIPSRAEWSAFGDFMYTRDQNRMDTSNYVNFGLADCCWSSSQESNTYAFDAFFDGGCVSDGLLYDDYHDSVRLAQTF